MNPKLVFVAIAIVAAFAITSMAGIGVFSGIEPMEAFAQNMTNMTGGNMTAPPAP
jgi:hypothetical protein